MREKLDEKKIINEEKEEDVREKDLGTKGNAMK